MKNESLTNWLVSERTRSTLGLGLIFLLVISPFYVIDSPMVAVVATLIGATSPIYLLRFWFCYDDPLWLLKVEAIIPFFFYGAVFGYFLNKSPKLSPKYAVTVAICFVITLVLLAGLLEFVGDIPQCKDRVETSL